MTADARLETLIRGTLSADLDGARGSYPAWPGSPAHRRIQGRPVRSAVPRRWAMVAAAAVLTVLSVGLVLRPTTLPAVGPGASGTPAEVASRLTVAGQVFDPATGLAGSVVLVELHTDGDREQVWLLSPEGEVRLGPALRSLPYAVTDPASSLPSFWYPTARRWASDGRSVAVINDFVESPRGAGSLDTRPPDQIWTAPLVGSGPWEVIEGDALVGPEAWGLARREIVPIPGGGGYVLSGRDRVLRVDDGRWAEVGTLPSGLITVGPTNDPAWWVVAQGEGVAIVDPPFHAYLWSPVGRTIDIGTDVLAIAPATREVGLTWVLRDGRGWQALRVEGYQPGWEPEAQGPAGDDPSYAIDPTGSVVLKAPAGGVTGQTRLIDRSTGAVLQAVDGAPVGRVAWFGDAAVFVVSIPGDDGLPADGGLVKLSPTGVEHIAWSRPIAERTGYVV